MRRFGLCATLAMCVYGLQRPQKNVLNDGHLSNQGTSFLRCHLSGPFRSMIEPQHQNSRSFAIKRKTRCGPAHTARRYIHQPT
jgi:hypothetical protein